MAIAGGLELNCVFAEGSQAQSCILTIYMILEGGMDTIIASVSINRGNSQENRQVLNLDLGEYVVRSVAEVESDGQVTTHRRRDILKVSVTEPTPATSSISTVLRRG